MIDGGTRLGTAECRVLWFQGNGESNSVSIRAVVPTS